MDISIIIVNYNTIGLVNNCLKSIFENVSGVSFEVIVVDNNSQDGSQSMIKENYPNVVLVENTVNMGFGKANNKALEVCKGKYLLLLNSDTELTSDGISDIFRFMENTPDAGVVGGKILLPDNKIQLSCKRFPNLLSEILIYSVSPIKYIPFADPSVKLGEFDYNSARRVDWISGAYMLIRADILHTTYLFDPKMFMFSEDLDLCARVNKLGYNIYFFPGSTIYHYHGGSAKKSLAKSIVYSFNSAVVYSNKSFSLLRRFVFKYGVVFIWHTIYFSLYISRFLFRMEKLDLKCNLYKNVISEWEEQSLHEKV